MFPSDTEAGVVCTRNKEGSEHVEFLLLQAKGGDKMGQILLLTEFHILQSFTEALTLSLHMQGGEKQCQEGGWRCM